jgi:two-component system nitrate/nitrite response regulator NarL
MAIDTLTDPAVRILVVDDYPAWCSKVRGTLQRPGWELIGEAWDGPDGVWKAGQLLPDIVILDIGLPGFSGIQAAKLIREKCPNTKIVFLSQETEDDIIKASFAAGAAAYVPKIKAVSDLPLAIKTVLQAAPAAIPC